MNDNVCMQIYENKNYRFNYYRILRFFFNRDICLTLKVKFSTWFYLNTLTALYVLQWKHI